MTNAQAGRLEDSPSVVLEQVAGDDFIVFLLKRRADEPRVSGITARVEERPVAGPGHFRPAAVE